ncbi:MAG: hypothetical protein C6I01_07070 [Epsilonproteobacteria bacterium]|nr:hypothetical protein [Campylobacterota bacterium]
MGKGIKWLFFPQDSNHTEPAPSPEETESKKFEKKGDCFGRGEKKVSKILGVCPKKEGGNGKGKSKSEKSKGSKGGKW